MKKIRILFISHTAHLDGAELSLLYLLTYLNKDKYDALVVLPDEGPLKKRIDQLGWETIILKYPLWIAYRHRSLRHFLRVFGRMLTRVKILRHVIRDRKIDIVYTNTITVIDGGIAAKLAGVPHIWHIREILSRNNLMKSYVPHYLMPLVVGFLSNIVIVPSQATRCDIAGFINNHKLKIINNGIDTKLFGSFDPISCQEWRKKLGISYETKIVALVGAFIEIKGQVDFVEAARIVSDKFHDCVFLLVGNDDNDYGSFVKKKVCQLHLNDKVYFLGFQSETAKIMSCIDILVSASWVESFSKVICEAMAAGKPVVATRCGGSEEIVVHGQSGLLVTPRDVLKLAEAILRLLVKDDEARMMGTIGKRRAEELYSIERCVRHIEAVFDGLY